MKNKLLLTAFVATFLIHASAFAQGALTPPGAPAPTMKSLAQVEPRTPISAPATISVPGSYYLTTNLTVTNGDAIYITASQVTLDLNGFTIASTSPTISGFGIALGAPGGNTDITILNGHIKGNQTNINGVFFGGGFTGGIYWAGAPPQNVRVTGVSVSACYNGIILNPGNASLVEGCTVKTCATFGIYADHISHCMVKECGSDAISGSLVTDSHGDSIGTGTGIDASGGMAIGCYASSGIVSGVALKAKIANSCVIGIGTTTIVNKYNMP
jgi:hypothetical protein